MISNIRDANMHYRCRNFLLLTIDLKAI